MLWVLATLAPVLAFPAPGCGRAANEVVLQGPTMGTYYRVRALAEAGESEAIRRLVERRLEAVDRAMSTYRDDSETSRFNGLAAGESFALSEEAWPVVELAWRVREESGGAFDPTVGPLVDAWGFGAPGRGAAPVPPGEDALTELARAVGGIELRPADRRLLKLHPGAALDLSAIAKGWAVDRVSEDLTRAGHANHLVEIGGEVRTAGHSSAGDPWRVAIERPAPRRARSAAVAPGRGVPRRGAIERPPAPAAPFAAAPNRTLPPGLQQVLELTDGALATSGDYRNYWEQGGIRYSHTIDPRTGRPVEHAVASASVVHASCAVADAYATALMVLGPDEGLRWANRHAISALLLVYREDSLEELPSNAFRDRFHTTERRREPAPQDAARRVPRTRSSV